MNSLTVLNANHTIEDCTHKNLILGGLIDGEINMWIVTGLINASEYLSQILLRNHSEVS